MSPTYLHVILTGLAAFSTRSLAAPADTSTIITGLLSQPTETSFPVFLSTRISAAGPEPTCAPGDGTVSCPLDDENTSYTASDCTDFVIECDQDRIGGDLPDSPTYPGTFGACVDSCAEDEACVAVVYDAGPCYLKSELGATAELPGATGARKASATVSAVLSTQASASETDFLSIQPIESTSTDEVPIFTISESAVETTTAVVTVTEPVVATVIETATVIVTVTGA